VRLPQSPGRGVTPSKGSHDVQRPPHIGRQPLRVALFCGTRQSVGGADRDWINIANALGPERIRLTWIGVTGTTCIVPHVRADILERTLDAGFPLFSYLVQENLRVHRSSWLWTKILGDHILRSIKPFLSLLGRLRAIEFDLVLSNAATITLGAAFAGARLLPHVWCVREWLDPERPACRNLARFITRTGRIVVVPSVATGEIFESSATVVPDGCDVASVLACGGRSSRQEVLGALDLPVERPLVVQVGGLREWKGQHVTLAALQLLAQTLSAPPFSLAFCGPGEGTYRERLLSALDQLPQAWQAAVRFVVFEAGNLSLVAAADFAVHPSVLPDPFPNAVREVMLLGKPVAASACGGLPDIIEAGETGLLVPPNDAAALAQAMLVMSARPDIRIRMGEVARQRALARFDSRVTAQRLFDLLLAVIGRRPD
jgi:glycosyltransferase involved in cell wall biosynthesis